MPGKRELMPENILQQNRFELMFDELVDGADFQDENENVENKDFFDIDE